MGSVSAILLAAGEAKRMGRLKQLMPFGEMTLVEKAVDSLLRSAASEVIVVLGAGVDEVMAKIEDRPVRIAYSPLYRRGMSYSIKAGLAMVDSQAQAFLVALADQPLVDSPTIDRLIEAFHTVDKGIIIPTYQGRRGHPVIFARKYGADFRRLEGDVGGRQIVSEHPEDVLEVNVDCPGVCLDLDTEEDYRALV
ncbi:MAG: nucleotidyltransferase family protein [Chloroflexi bacterium]|nr:nucleotidyltransferase family protein [Chloroflexota bacterium]